MDKLPYLVDVPVLLVFFVRPDTLQQVFDQIKKARPSKLYLCQDGPRSNRSDDIENINKCRKIVENIDWECEVHKDFAEVNYGCDPNIYRAINWIFQSEERMIFLEDDSVPALSYFAFCKQMLDKYNDDKRISIISSFNLAEKWNVPSDYFFTQAATLSGCWGTWRRVWEERDETLGFTDDEYFKKLFHGFYNQGHLAYKDFSDFKLRNREFKEQDKITSFEVLIGSARLLNSSLAVMPSKNMNCNIGMTSNATHGTANLSHLNRKLQKIFYMKVYEVPENLNHPRYMIPDMAYSKKVADIIGAKRYISTLRKIEMKLRRLIFK
ncbi:glycosyltransferase family protein [Chryseobacterium salivictor]|uniref:GNT-I family protein n=1 Tax=Chryseobacterium salivictor TaxID=2547600 RepID=A0A4P6ZJ28_9FLAO|nr:hemolysin activation protein [Chryseobacterium salivictor]QBO59678.1 hypothetical protein NBC122_02878 [Chryseobacterium salivictor]